MNFQSAVAAPGKVLCLVAAFVGFACLPALVAQEVKPSQKSQAASSTTLEGEQKEWIEPAYIEWLEGNSLLRQAEVLSRQISGRGVQWRHPYAEPRPEELVSKASVWVLGYPGSVITRTGESVIATWAEPALWSVFKEIGVDLLHTGPVKRSGGVRGRQFTPTVDGWFDRISLQIDPQLGSEEDYNRMVSAATEQGGLIAGDLVPLHTGLGADFQLALRNHGDYPGMYTMVEVPSEFWHLLPTVSDLWGIAPVSKSAIVSLAKKSLVPGLINSNDAAPDARTLSGWDASAPILGVDGKTRRWVFLHFFKPGQPTLNWLDPSMAGQRAIYGDVVKTVHVLGTRVVRLDAVPFLGIENQPGLDLTWHYQHPLAAIATDQLAMFTRKLGGWSFQELNVPLKQLKALMVNGPDLSYDFFTRAQYLHALLMEDASLLRLSFRMLQESGIELGSLVHDLQNHDEITYQLVELDFRGDEKIEVGGQELFGRQIRERTLNQMRERAAGARAPFNQLYRPEADGLATTFAGFVAAGLDIEDPYSARADEVDQIKQAHLLLAAANAFQPGVFSLSGWDLVGALPLPVQAVEERVGDGDYRWVNRGGIDLMGVNPEADESAFGLPRAQALYGSLPEQLRDPRSFASVLKTMLEARKLHGIAGSRLIDVPETIDPELCALVLQLQGRPRLAVTLLNYGRSDLDTVLDLSGITLLAESTGTWRYQDALGYQKAGTLGKALKLPVRLPALTGTFLILEE